MGYSGVTSGLNFFYFVNRLMNFSLIITSFYSSVGFSFDKGFSSGTGSGCISSKCFVDSSFFVNSKLIYGSIVGFYSEIYGELVLSIGTSGMISNYSFFSGSSIGFLRLSY